MFSLPHLLTLLLAHHALLTSALPAVAAPPAQYTANPSIGGGSGTYKDSAHFRIYGVDTATAGSALKIMEAAHQCFVEELGWRTPGLSYKTTGDNGPWYKMNIYKAEESEMPGAAAQTWTDAGAGLAYLKVVGKYVKEPGVIVHEFGHAMHYSEKNWIDQTRCVCPFPRLLLRVLLPRYFSSLRNDGLFEISDRN